MGKKVTWLADLVDKIHDKFYGFGLNETVAEIVFLSVMAAAVLVLCVLSYFAARWFLSAVLGYLAGKTRSRWDDILIESRFFARLACLAPALVVFLFAYAFPYVETVIQRVVQAFMVFAGLLAINALLSAVVEIYKTIEVSRSRPIKGFVQVVRIVAAIVGTVLILAVLMDKSPWVFLTGMGALTAVLLIIFKDSLLGLVASFQITAADMVREGDWISMPQYGADGDCIDLSLHTCKVRNWDKTITTIPTYALVSESFKNWRGMEESGGRRIKRSINIDMQSILFCPEEMLDRFEKIQEISGYVKEKRREIDAHNREVGADAGVPVNGRRLTNLGTFRAYVVAFLRSHPAVHSGMTFLVRQLAPTEHGLPLEIYVFSRDQAWARYEEIQADLFDHLLAALPAFGLRVFQSPSGGDLRALSGVAPAAG
jgi:miniconductance mechanosensitive channel